MSRYDIAIIGGGASGMMCAVQLKRVRPDLRVVVLERQARVGRKLLATGNGRCNLSNIAVAPSDYCASADFVAPTLERFTPERVLLTFQALGLYCAADDSGRVYPASDQAASVLDALRLSMDELNVAVRPGFEVRSLAHGFALTAIDGQTVCADRVVLAAGGPAGGKLGGTDSAHRLAKSLGHAVTDCLPALVQLKTEPDRVRALKGIRANCALRLCSNEHTLEETTGEVLFTEYGLSGIAAMSLGKRAATLLAQSTPCELAIDLTQCGAQATMDILKNLRSAIPQRTLEDFFSGLVPKRLGQTLIKSAGLSPLSRQASTLSDRALNALTEALTDWRLPITGTKDMDDAQVTAGGLDTAMFDATTLESKLVPGLYATGEALNVDGPCGGYNLHWAWASGMAAANAIARQVKG